MKGFDEFGLIEIALGATASAFSKCEFSSETKTLEKKNMGLEVSSSWGSRRFGERLETLLFSFSFLDRRRRFGDAAWRALRA